MRLRRCDAAAFGLLTLAPVLTACGNGTSIEVGDRVPAREDDQFIDSGVEASLVLPLGRLEINMGEVTRSLKAEDTRQREALQAPSGSAFLPITWQYDASTFGDYADYLEQASPVVDLVSDGAKYRLPAPEPTGQGATSFYILVSGFAEDPKLEVDVDGVTQTVDLVTGEREVGRAQALYDLAPRKDRTSSCREGAEFKLRLLRPAEFTCTISQAARIPYAGSAWAREGHAWLVLTVRTSMRRYDVITEDLKSGAIYVAAAATSTFTLGDLEPAAVFEDVDDSKCPDSVRGGCRKVYHLVFDVTDENPSRLTAKQTYDLDLYSVWGSGGEQLEKESVTFPVTVRARVR